MTRNDGVIRHVHTGFNDAGSKRASDADIAIAHGEAIISCPINYPMIKITAVMRNLIDAAKAKKPRSIELLEQEIANLIGHNTDLVKHNNELLERSRKAEMSNELLKRGEAELLKGIAEAQERAEVAEKKLEQFADETMEKLADLQKRIDQVDSPTIYPQAQPEERVEDQAEELKKFFEQAFPGATVKVIPLSDFPSEIPSSFFQQSNFDLEQARR